MVFGSAGTNFPPNSGATGSLGALESLLLRPPCLGAVVEPLLGAWAAWGGICGWTFPSAARARERSSRAQLAVPVPAQVRGGRKRAIVSSQQCFLAFFRSPFSRRWPVPGADFQSQFLFYFEPSSQPGTCIAKHVLLRQLGARGALPHQ